MCTENETAISLVIPNLGLVSFPSHIMCSGNEYSSKYPPVYVSIQQAFIFSIGSCEWLLAK